MISSKSVSKSVLLTFCMYVLINVDPLCVGDPSCETNERECVNTTNTRKYVNSLASVVSARFLVAKSLQMSLYACSSSPTSAEESSLYPMTQIAHCSFIVVGKMNWYTPRSSSQERHF